MDSLEASMQLDSVAFYSREDLAEALGRLRREAPVYWFENEEVSFWALSKAEDIRHVAVNPTLFSSQSGVSIIDFRMMKKMGSGVTAGPPDSEPSMLNTDPPLHRKLRNLVGKAFTPRVVSGLEPRIREIVRAELDEVPAQESFDFVEALAVPVPMYVIAELLGIPRSDRPLFRHFTSQMASVQVVDQMSEADVAQFMTSMQEMNQYFEEKLIEREASLTDDLMSGLLTAEVDGERLSRASQVAMCVLLLAGGNETTRNLISGTVIALAEHPDQFAVLGADLGLLETAVDEFLRWITPIKTMGRVATADTQIRGQHINAGDCVLMLFQSANRDEEVWENPEVFDVRRQRPPRTSHLRLGRASMSWCQFGASSKREFSSRSSSLASRSSSSPASPFAFPRNR